LSEGGDNVGKEATADKVTLSVEEVTAFRKFMADQQAIEDSLKNVNLSDDEDEENPAIKLANETASNALKLARESQIELAAEKWKNTVAELTREGVPPVALSKAESLMKLPKTGAIKLSVGDDEVDPQAVVLSVLESLKGTIDLSKADGHEFNDSESGEDKDYERFRDEFMRDHF
jgi:hypothetical protein